MHSDAFFTIGKAHPVCQDYARAGKTVSKFGVDEGSRTFAIVSDGCSGSPDTDFGARLLTMATVEGIDVLGDRLPSKVDWLIWHALDKLPQNLRRQSLDATLLAAYTRDDGQVQVIVCGDGVVAARKRETGQVEVIEIDCQNAPSYLSYLLNPDRLLVYREALEATMDASHTHEGRILRRWASLEKLRDDDPPDNEWDWPVIIEGEPGKTVTYDNFPFSINFDSADYDLVMVFSDGVQSFQDAETMESIPMSWVLGHLTDIKSFTGEFMARRCKSFLSRFCVKNRWQHYDDLGVAAIYLGE